MIVIIMAIIKINSNNNTTVNDPTNNTITPTKIILPSPTPTVFIDKPNPTDQNPDFPLKELLPYETDDFIIKGYIKPLTISVESKNGDKKISEQKLRDWLNENELILGENKIVWEE